MSISGEDFGITHTRGNKAMGIWYREDIAALSKTYTFGDVKDGLSNTIAMSERRIGNRDKGIDFAQSAILGSVYVNDPEVARRECLTTRDPTDLRCRSARSR